MHQSAAQAQIILSRRYCVVMVQNTTHSPRAGYGSHAIGDCWLPAWLVGIQCILAVLLEAIFLGIIFAKISHPKGRSRTIIISECACIARRDGILKL